MNKYLGWDSDYIIKDKIIFKENAFFNAHMCDSYISDDRIITLNIKSGEFIKVCSSPTERELIFKYKNQCYIYSGLVGSLMVCCYTKEEYRSDRSTKLINNG